ncbi:MAG: biotin/lipoyl-containing protein, partial [Pseudomonadota bacterium]
NPESDPFVRVGQEIRAGDVVCIVEAMKMFNQIESDVDGKVISMLVETGQPVEFDQPLMIVR